MERSKLLFAVAGILLLVVVLFYGWRWFSSSPRERSADELAQAALGASTPEERATAAAELIARGWPALQQMQRVVRESKVPEVRAMMIQGLSGQRDYDSMPVFLDGLDDPALVVRVRSAAAVRRIECFDAEYQPEDPPEKRQPAVKALRDNWERLRNAPGFARARATLIESRQNSQ
ncbi:MAG: hypothetical protein ABR915_19615 [Thermoguttaceae bacterium]|jgi:hypothetical protein